MVIPRIRTNLLSRAVVFEFEQLRDLNARKEKKSPWNSCTLLPIMTYQNSPDFTVAEWSKWCRVECSQTSLFGPKVYHFLSNENIAAFIELCGSRKYPYPHRRGSLEIPEGEGVLKAKFFFKGKYEPKLEFLEGWGVQTKKPSVGGVWIFSGTAHSNLTIFYLRQFRLN